MRTEASHQTSSPRPHAPSLHHLRSAVKGEVLDPTSPAYNDARPGYLTGFPQQPAAIIRAVDSSDVIRVVTLARETGTELAVRAGGHSIAGHSLTDGGWLLDLSAMRAVNVEAATKTAWADGGVTAGAYTTIVGEHGLATGFGDAGSVGIGGITLGGGVGFLHRKYGMTIDSLLAAEVVTADGALVYTDAETHPDLFWAIRGGGGNFGVVTRFKYRLHEVNDVVGGMLILPATPDTISGFVAEAAAAPEELSAVMNVMLSPSMPFLPPEYHGRPMLMATLVYAGPVDAGLRAMAPFRALGTPVVDLIRPMRYPEIYDTGEHPHPPHMAVRMTFGETIDRSDAELVLDRLAQSNALMRTVQFRVLGGAVARVAADATSFAHRDRGMMLLAGAVYARGDEKSIHEAWAGDLADALRQGEPGAYVNFLGEEDEKTRLREAYPARTWERLRRIKAAYDPDNVFCRNYNIPPA